MEPYKPNKPWISVNLPSREELIAMAMGLIPGGRALQYFRDNPEGSVLETLKLAAEDVVPFYGTYRNDGDVSDYAKEAVMLGVPMPYIKHPKTGAPIPNNLKEALGKAGWSSVKQSWKPDSKRARRKLYADPNTRTTMVRDGRNTRDIATGNTVEQTLTERPELIEGVLIGPNRQNTGTNVVNRGTRQRGTNTLAYDPNRNHGVTNGKNGWQGDMYPPGRSLRKDDMYGPFQWDNAYNSHLSNNLAEMENKWEYLINQTRKSPQRPNNFMPKEDAVSIALRQGRPDIAERIIADDKPRVSQTQDPRINSYASGVQKANRDIYTWLDRNNRIIEKELRENFAMLPEDPDIRFRFADYYGVPDLYSDWLANPDYWKEFTEITKRNRTARSSAIRHYDRQYGRDIER